MSKWDKWIGQTQEQSDILTPGLLDRFRATIDSEQMGSTAPQGIHWCLCLPSAATAQLDTDGHPLRGGFMPPIPLPRRMWAASDVTFHSPLILGATVTRRSTIAAITEKNGGSGLLIFVTMKHETMADGIVSITEEQTLVYREAPATSAATAIAKVIATAANKETIDVSNWHKRSTLVPSEALLFRYSALTFNSHRIHYDRPYTIDKEGYRGLVVHGPLIATLLLDTAAQAFGPNTLKQFSMRARSPAFAGEPLHFAYKAEGNAVTLIAQSKDGQIIMSAEAKM